MCGAVVKAPLGSVYVGPCSTPDSGFMLMENQQAMAGMLLAFCHPRGRPEGVCHAWFWLPVLAAVGI